MAPINNLYRKKKISKRGKNQYEKPLVNPNIIIQTSFTYNADRVVGNGSFGVVFQVGKATCFNKLFSKATVAETGEVVAIKKVYQDKRYKNREL